MSLGLGDLGQSTKYQRRVLDGGLVEAPDSDAAAGLSQVTVKDEEIARMESIVAIGRI